MFTNSGSKSVELFSPGTADGAALIAGLKWTKTTITYAFPRLAGDYDTNAGVDEIQYGLNEPLSGFAPMDTVQAGAVRMALDNYAAVCGLNFVEVNDAAGATVRVARSGVPETAWAYLPSPAAQGGDVWLGGSLSYDNAPVRGNYSFSTILHELGHTVGLKHGHEDHGNGALDYDEDSMEYSVMTYRSHVGDRMEGGLTNERAGYAQSLMQLDISALQQLYGANYEHNSGNTTYSWSPDSGEMFINGVGQGAPVDNRIFLTIWDGGGEDTFDFANYRTDLTVDLRPGKGTITDEDQLATLHQSRGRGDEEIDASASIYNARLFMDDSRALIENARGGSGDDFIRGNAADNRLSGGGGSDLIRGGEGNDTLKGGNHADRLYGNSGDDVLAGQRGNDRLFGGQGDDRLVGNLGRDILKGAAGNDTLKGGADRDLLVGGGGNDLLKGGAGNDRLIGGGGADDLIGGGGRDIFIFRPGQGRDTIGDFGRGPDRINLKAFHTDFDSLDIHEQGGDTIIRAPKLFIRLEHVDADDIGHHDFLF